MGEASESRTAGRKVRAVLCVLAWALSRGNATAGAEAQATPAPDEEAAPVRAPLWPEELGWISREDRERALARVELLAAGRRSVEARYQRGLLRLEPDTRRDPAGAREDLAFVIASGDPSWSPLGRYALAWLDEEEGRRESARSAYQRLCVDHPGTGVATRAAVRLARALHREGKPGRAAWWLQSVAERPEAASLGVAELEDAAVRAVLRESRSAPGWDPSSATALATELRGAVALARGPGADVLLADRKTGAVFRLDAGGRVLRRWDVPEPSALAVDPFGRVFAASGSVILRLDAAGAVPFARQGDLSPASSIAVDARGRVYVLDRRGSRLGVAEPGGGAPRIVREKRGSHLVAVLWDGGRIVGLEERTGNVLALGADVAERVLAGSVVADPVSLAASPSGEIAVLGRSGVVALVDANGRAVDRLDARPLGAARTSGIALGWDGSLDLYDETSKRVVRIP